jgi:hypothetical protein
MTNDFTSTILLLAQIGGRSRKHLVLQGESSMGDPLEILERLGRLHAEGILSDQEFAEQKSRVLGAGLESPPPAPPASGPSWLSRNKWLAGGVGAALAVGGLFAVLAVSDLRGSAPSKAAAATNAAADAEAPVKVTMAPTEAGGNDLHALLAFDDPAKCGLAQEFKSLTGTLAARQPGGNADPVRLAGLSQPVTPGVERMMVEGNKATPVVAQLPIQGAWHGLRVTDVRTVTWPDSNLRSIQIRLADPAAETLRILNEKQFNLSAVNQARTVSLGNGRWVAIGVEDVGGGSALTCVHS